MASITSPIIRLGEDVEILRHGQRGLRIVNCRRNTGITLGSHEYRLLRILLHAPSVDEAINAFRHRFDNNGLSRHQVLKFVRRLKKYQLLEDSVSDQQSRRETSVAQRPEEPIIEPTTLVERQRAYEMVDIVSPDSIRQPGAMLNLGLDLLVTAFGWLLHPIWIIPVLIMAFVASQIVLRHASSMFLEFHYLVESFPVFLYFVFLVIPKLFLLSVFQGLLVGMVCRKYGARVRAARVYWRLGFIPIFRMNVRGAFAVMNKRGKRMSTSIPFWMVLALGSISVLGWNIAGSSGLRNVFLLMLPPCLGRLLMQCNIFNRFSAAHFWLCERIGDLRFFDTSRDLFRTRSRQAESTVSLGRTRKFWYRMYRQGYTIYRMVILGLIILGLLFVMRSLNAGHTPVWVFEFLVVALAVISSWTRVEKRRIAS